MVAQVKQPTKPKAKPKPPAQCKKLKDAGKWKMACIGTQGRRKTADFCKCNCAPNPSKPSFNQKKFDACNKDCEYTLRINGASKAEIAKTCNKQCTKTATQRTTPYRFHRALCIKGSTGGKSRENFCHKSCGSPLSAATKKPVKPQAPLTHTVTIQ